MEIAKELAQILYYLGAGVAAVGAFLVYRHNSRLERPRWATMLFDKFYETEKYKEIRSTLDTYADTEAVEELVLREEDKFTDYLNFFEYVAFLKACKQLRRREVEALLGYFLECIARHERPVAS